uniref:Uncharacterized protein n=1 Tax=viral metagenome TaxID=1070528 RepID=A0A6H1ZHB1_9ZZZZ
MPYKRSGNKVMHKKGESWKVKQTCKSSAAAESAIRLLRGIEHGMQPKKRKKK